MPGLWFYSMTTNLLISVAINDNGNTYYKSDALPLHRFTKVLVKQEKHAHRYFFVILINGKQVYKVENNIPRVYSNVQVWGSDKWYTAANAELRNLKYSKLGKIY